MQTKELTMNTVDRELYEIEYELLLTMTGLDGLTAALTMTETESESGASILLPATCSILGEQVPSGEALDGIKKIAGKVKDGLVALKDKILSLIKRFIAWFTNKQKKFEEAIKGTEEKLDVHLKLSAKGEVEAITSNGKALDKSNVKSTPIGDMDSFKKLQASIKTKSDALSQAMALPDGTVVEMDKADDGVNKVILACETYSEACNKELDRAFNYAIKLSANAGISDSDAGNLEELLGKVDLEKPLKAFYSNLGLSKPGDVFTDMVGQSVIVREEKKSLGGQTFTIPKLSFEKNKPGKLKGKAFEIPKMSIHGLEHMVATVNRVLTDRNRILDGLEDDISKLTRGLKFSESESKGGTLVNGIFNLIIAINGDRMNYSIKTLSPSVTVVEKVLDVYTGLVDALTRK